MGKQKHRKRPGIPIQSGHPGCIWGVIVHVLNHPQWHYVKKRLPHRRHAVHKQAEGDGNPRNKVSNPERFQETSVEQVEEVRQPTPANKTSVGARLRSLIGEEFSKKKGRHHRTSSFPAPQLTRTYSIHHLEVSDKELFTEIVSTDVSSRTADESNEDANSSVDLLPQKSFEKTTANEETSEDSKIMPTKNGLGHNQVEEHERPFIKNHMLLQENCEDAKQAALENKLKNAKGLSIDASLSQSKELQDVLDIINSNKEFFLKVLLDPSSPLAYHFHNQQTLSARGGLTRSETFPLPDISGGRVPGPSKLKQKQGVIRSCKKEEGNLKVQKSTECDKLTMPLSTTGYREDGIQKLNQAVAETSNGSSSGSANHLKDLVRNQVVIKRFKDLRQKIKHAIKESKNERYRIIMDGVLHKIPHSQGFSKVLNTEILDQLKDSSINHDGKDSPPTSMRSDQTALVGKRLPQMRRAASVNETLDRYSQLYESSFNKEAKQPISERLKLRREDAASPSMSTPESLGRIFSLPEIKSYFDKSEDLSDASSSQMPARTPVVGTVSINSLGEQNNTDLPIASGNCLQLGTPAESRSQENFVEFIETDSGIDDKVGSASIANSNEEVDKLSYELSNSMTRDGASNGEWDVGPKTTEQSEPSPVTVLDFNFKEVRESIAEFSISEESEEKLGYLPPGEQEALTDYQHESGIDGEVQCACKHVDINIPCIQVDAKDKSNFDYVKNVLELSGFSGTESLGTWHSDDQPVDPSVYEEVEGCILLDPDCSGNEGGNCNHMLLFDLINEVLTEAYERSYSYYPNLLSSLCHIRPMPAGNHVLQEVWANISSYLSLKPEFEQSLDHIASRDLAKNDGWMNLQFNSECVGLEVEDLIFYELLEEAMFL